MPPAIEGLDHWTYVSRDVDAAQKFYVEVLGATVPKWSAGPPAVVLGGTTIDFFPPDEGGPSPGPMGQHYALRIRLQDYDTWVEHLRARHVPITLACHGPQRMSIYLDDPDGYHLELTLGLPDPETGRREIEKRGLKTYVIPGGFEAGAKREAAATGS
jgi:catechol 2,3-dioxygenase-like lactoylglutathione lyase family enzyme